MDYTDRCKLARFKRRMIRMEKRKTRARDRIPPRNNSDVRVEQRYTISQAYASSHGHREGKTIDELSIHNNRTQNSNYCGYTIATVKDAIERSIVIQQSG